ncbi:glycerophosphodiester phosphodiesterase family protein [Yersinia vastinensis]|uniref:glycerophosphodiester phosphodiesterase family protein n=1 Tax=Yersinia vastinensis TaxID=2890318 RepID=UPI0005E7064A|nr:glycerophosphodiester phosphodiesterase family protein [Yersinia vastinensis]OVZ96318.1 glycerophosphodiester phosphodiesterase [Yersinia frederiksenii]CNH97090.1 glycerophosphoryl diester phosphodiesterase [Yersinia frederiksenii]
MERYISALLLFSCFNSVFAAPFIVAHRAGTAEHPENTHHAISMALQNEADVIWLSVQLSKDDIPVLYRPSDLNSLTDGSGFVSQYSWDELQQLDAAYSFHINNLYIYRGRGIKIPSLQQILRTYPETKFILDIKSPNADPIIMANILDKTIKETNSHDRVIFYSTDKKYLKALPHDIRKFESRNLTRNILANAVMANNCKINKRSESMLSHGPDKYHAFELRRDVKVVEKYTLGKGSSQAQLIWNQQAMACFKTNNDTKILLIGINSYDDYQLAENLGADYVMVDSPAVAKNWR